jgi:putative membrane protein
MSKGLGAREEKDRYKILITVLSIAIPLTVALLFRVKVEGYDLTFLPPIYAAINGLTALLLITAVLAVRSGRQLLHKRIMITCIGLSASFLIMYVAYHATTQHTPFGGSGTIRYIYYFVLISHILLSVCVIPFVLFTFARALAGNFSGHRRLAKYTFPLWLYVAATGVIVYLMISPYYK